MENAEAFLNDNFQNGIGKSLKTVFPSCSEIRLKKYTDSTPHRRVKSVWRKNFFECLFQPFGKNGPTVTTSRYHVNLIMGHPVYIVPTFYTL